MAKTEQLFHPATGVYQEIDGNYIGAHLANGWVRADKPNADVDTAEETPIEKPKGKRK